MTTGKFTDNRDAYVAPLVEVAEICVEQGFAASVEPIVDGGEF